MYAARVFAVYGDSLGAFAFDAGIGVSGNRLEKAILIIDKVTTYWTPVSLPALPKPRGFD
jgi:hypothetical protein